MSGFKPIDSLYVHIPFCSSICGYCDFPKVIYRSDWAESYLMALFREIESFHIGKLKTIYVGGGTPTSLSSDQLDSLLSFLERFLSEESEFTVEANPESLSLEKARFLATHHVNRISLGIESCQSKFLSLMGRKHDFDLAKKALDNAIAVGITNLNADMIFALPGENLEEALFDAEALLSLPIKHFSAYSLILENQTVFACKGFKEASEDVQGEMLEKIIEKAKEHGFHHYEISNFSKPGYESKHNLTYWRDERYFGCGLGASGYVNNVRYTNTKSLSLYIKEPAKNRQEEIVSPKDDLEYFLLTNLRLSKGFELSLFEDRFGKDFFSLFPSFYLEKERGLLTSENGRILCTDRGLLILDSILEELFLNLD